jgi:hypothetical protein
MHYFDLEKEYFNILEIVVYQFKNEFEDEFSHRYSKLNDLQITSIVNCKHVPIHALKNFLIDYKYTLLKHLEDKIEFEQYYLLKIEFTGYDSDTYKVISVENVTNSEKQLLKLH